MVILLQCNTDNDDDGDDDSDDVDDDDDDDDDNNDDSDKLSILRRVLWPPPSLRQASLAGLQICA